MNIAKSKEQTMKNKAIGLIAMFITVIIWGLSFISIELTVDIFKPMSLGLFRFIIAFVILTIFSLTKVGKIEKVNKKDLPKFFWAGFIGITVYFLFENNGVMKSNASNASLIIATIPIFTILMESIAFKTKISLKLIFSVIISMIGVVFIVDTSFSEMIKFSDMMVGNLLMLGAVFSWGIYSIITKPLFTKYNQNTITYYQILFGLIMFIPFALFEDVSYSLITPNVLMHLFFLGIFASAMGYFLYVIAMNSLGLGVSSLFLNAIPLVTVLFSYFFLGQEISISKILGGILVVTSVVIATYSGKLKDK
jgi:drug/metabolite transporter (DMT)-like permease